MTVSRVNQGKVLIIGPQPFYEERGTPIALHHVAKALTELGLGVDFLTYPLGSDVKIPGVTVIRVGNPLRFRSVPIGLSLRKVWLDLLLFFKAKELLKKNQYFRVHASEEGVFIPLLLLPNDRGKIVYDMACSLPEQLKGYPTLGSRPAQLLLRRIERWALRQVGVVFCSSGLRRYALSSAPGITVFEWVFPNVFETVDRESIQGLRKELGFSPEKVPLVYTGSFAPYQGLEVVLETLPVLCERMPELVFVFVGGTEEETRRVLDQIPDAVHHRVRVINRQPRTRMPAFLGLADILLSPRGDHGNAPLKIFEYMAAGKPIIASNVPSHREFPGEGRAVLYDPNPEGVTAAVEYLYRNPSERTRLARAAEDFAKEYLGWDRFRESLSVGYGLKGQ